MEIVLPDQDLAGILGHPLVRGLLESSSDGAVVIDARTREVLAMNGRARALLGLDPDEAASGHCQDTIRSPMCAQCCPLQGEAATEGESAVQTLFYRRDDRAPVHAEARMLVIRDPLGRALAGIELIHDQRERHHLERALRARRRLHGLVGRSLAMQRLYDRVEELALCDLGVLVLGEAGVGKRRAAEALHLGSSRGMAPLVALDLAERPPGQVRDAFREGLEQGAQGSVLVLRADRLEAPAQEVLLEFATSAAGRRGARLLFTARQLEGLVEPLRAHLASAILRVPPLRERLDDLPQLAEEILQEPQEPELPRCPGVDADALAVLARRSWPGNVEELETTLRVAALRAAGGRIQASHLEAVDPTAGAVETLADAEARAIVRALVAADGNLSEAARLLGIDRTTLWRKLKRGRGA